MNVRLKTSQKIKVLNAASIYPIMQAVLLRENSIRRNQEHFWVLGLNNANKILFIELISLGATNRLQVAPREIFRIAIYKSAVKMILVHNHPSGTVTITNADKDFTDRIIKSGQLLNIEIIDHLIISEHSYNSFADAGTLEELKHSGLYELVDREKTALNSIKLEAEREKERVAVAKRMLKAGINPDVIQQITKLKKSTISKL